MSVDWLSRVKLLSSRRNNKAQAANASTGLEGGGTWFGSSFLTDDLVSSQLPPGSEFSGEAGGGGRNKSHTTFARIYRLFIGARAAVGLVLLGAMLLARVLGASTSWVGLAISLAYAVQTLAMWRLPQADAHRLLSRESGAGGTLGRWPWLATIGTDVATLSVLHAFAPSGNISYPVLLALPVLMAGVLTPRRHALGVAAVVTLMLLVVAASNLGSAADTTAQLTQAGLLGAGFFVIAFLASELADRLASAGQSAQGNMELARQQAQLNRLVIDEMQDGVLVVDRKGRVRAANPSARRLLGSEGLCPPAPFPLREQPDWAPLVHAVEQAFVDGPWPAGGREIAIPLATPQGGIALRELRLRVRFTQRRDAQGPEDLCVLFIEDMRSVHARARHDKLAAMGRMSASIAHEIRNPLAAIAQANALLAEDAQEAGQQRLTSMVAANVERLKRIVDDVLDVAPGVRTTPPIIELAEALTTVCDDWLRSAGLPAPLGQPGPGCGLERSLPTDAARIGVRFEPDHLRRVMVNLLDNAWRHGSQASGAIEVGVELRQRRGEGRDPREFVVISVRNDGEPIPADIERSLFEPFFSTRSRGSGLGLYICRELCERYGASIEYRQHPPFERRCNEFTVAMPVIPLNDGPSNATS